MKISEIISIYENRESWVQVIIGDTPINVGWAHSKDAANISKHNGLKLSDGIEVICSKLTKRSAQFINNEDREFLIGPNSTYGILVVIVAYIETTEDLDALRIISVRRPEKSEVITYMTVAKQDTSELTEDSILTEDSKLTSWWEHFRKKALRKAQEKAQRAQRNLEKN